MTCCLKSEVNKMDVHGLIGPLSQTTGGIMPQRTPLSRFTLALLISLTLTTLLLHSEHALPPRVVCDWIPLPSGIWGPRFQTWPDAEPSNS